VVNVGFGQSFQLFFSASHIIFANIRGEGIEIVFEPAPNVSNRNAAVFSLLADDFHILFTALLSEFWHHHSDYFPIVAGACAQVGEIGNRFFNVLQSALVIGGNQKGSRLDILEARQLGEGGGLAVILDHNFLKKCWVCSPCPHGLEIVLHHINSFPIFSFASASTSAIITISISAQSSQPALGRDQGANSFTLNGFGDVPGWFHSKNNHRHLVIHAQAKRCGIHDFEPCTRASW
jgi:hypothetical protein